MAIEVKQTTSVYEQIQATRGENGKLNLPKGWGTPSPDQMKALHGQGTGKGMPPSRTSKMEGGVPR